MPDYLGAKRHCAKSGRLSVGATTAAMRVAVAAEAPEKPPRTPKRRRPRQPHPGTRIIRYRCFLPDLAEFANYRRGGTDGATIDVGLENPLNTARSWRRERDSNPRYGLSRIHTFQACSFNHSDTSPHAASLARRIGARQRSGRIAGGPDTGKQTRRFSLHRLAAGWLTDRHPFAGTGDPIAACHQRRDHPLRCRSDRAAY